MQELFSLFFPGEQTVYCVNGSLCPPPRFHLALAMHQPRLERQQSNAARIAAMNIPLPQMISRLVEHAPTEAAANPDAGPADPSEKLDHSDVAKNFACQVDEGRWVRHCSPRFGYGT
jgi:hypothetical protein